MEHPHQAVRHSLAGPHDEHVQVDRNGHGPEERAGVGESGDGPLSHAVQRVGAEHPPDSEGVGDGGQPVGHRQVDQQSPRSRPQVRPHDVGEDDERGAHDGQRARAQDDHLLGQVHHRLVPLGHRGRVILSELPCCACSGRPRPLRVESQES